MNEAGRLHEEFFTTVLELAELGREDSNLQLPQSRGRRAQRRPKQDKNLGDPSDVEQTPAKPKIDPETVTKPSPPATPAEDL